MCIRLACGDGLPVATVYEYAAWKKIRFRGAVRGSSGGNTCRNIMRNYSRARLAVEQRRTAECGRRHKMPLISLKKDYLSPVCCGSLIRMIQFRAHARSQAVIFMSEISARILRVISFIFVYCTPSFLLISNNNTLIIATIASYYTIII